MYEHLDTLRELNKELFLLLFPDEVAIFQVLIEHTKILLLVIHADVHSHQTSSLVHPLEMLALVVVLSNEVLSPEPTQQVVLEEALMNIFSL